MNNNKKLIVYPYDVNFAPILRHLGYLEGYEIVNILSLSGWGGIGKNAGYVDGGENINYTVYDNFDDLLSTCDTVLFVKPQIELDFNKFIIPKILKAIELRKNIMCSYPMDKGTLKMISSKCTKNNIVFKYFNTISELDSYKDLNTTYESLYNIETPIITVIGASERTNKFEIQLVLREKLQEIGYKVSQVGSRTDCGFLGFHPFPGFMFNRNLHESSKIVLFNQYIKKIELSEKPDVIIIGVPGGIMPINKKFTTKFGVTAFEISNAIESDFVILSVLYENYLPHFFEKISFASKGKFGFDVDCINLSNVQFDWRGSDDANTVLYITFDNTDIDKSISNLNNVSLPVYNIFNSNDCMRLVNQVINKLSNNASINIV